MRGARGRRGTPWSRGCASRYRIDAMAPLSLRLEAAPPAIDSPMRAPDPGSSASREPAILEARVIRAVVRELPPEHVPVEAPRVGDARGGHFGVIDASIQIGRASCRERV